MPFFRTSFFCGLLILMTSVADAEDVTLSGERLRAFLDQIDPTETVRELSQLGTRIPGYEGSERAADYVIQKLSSYGLHPRIEEFQVAVPKDRGASLRLKGKAQINLRCLWPNYIRTSTLPAAGIQGPLIYLRDGALNAFNGKAIRDAIVLMDFNCATRWLNAAMMGAQAIIFVEPDKTAFRTEATQKFLQIPAAIPRFWMGREELRTFAKDALGDVPEDQEQLLDVLAEMGKEGSPSPTVRLQANMDWYNATGKNILATLRGTDPQLASQKIVIESYYDSISAVPSLAPGADAACGIATMLEMARLFAANPPRRTVEFLATSAHFQALAGIREWTARNVHLPREKGMAAYDYFLKDAAAFGDKGKLLQMRETADKLTLDPTDLESVEIPMSKWWWFAIFLAICTVAALAKLYTAELKVLLADRRVQFLFGSIILVVIVYNVWASVRKSQQDSITHRYHQRLASFIEDYRLVTGDLHAAEQLRSEIDMLYDAEQELLKALAAEDKERLYRAGNEIFKLFHRGYPTLYRLAQLEMPEPEPALFIGLDLSSRNQQIGLFYKGNFYDQAGEGGEFRIQRQMAPIADKLLDMAEVLKEELPELRSDIVSGVVPKRGRDWRSYMPDQIALDCEAPLLAGIGSLSFVTTNDTRGLVDTPGDLFKFFNAENLQSQAKLIFPLLYEVLNNPHMPLTFNLEKNQFSDIYAQVIEDSLIAYLPKTPVYGAVASVGLTTNKSMMGVRGYTFSFTDEDGAFGVPGVTRERGQQFPVCAFLLDPKDGSIDKIANLATNKGMTFLLSGKERTWATRNLVKHELSGDYRLPRKTDARLPLFKCSSLMIYDLLDQLYFTSLKSISILDARTNTAPKYFAMFMGRKGAASYSEPCAVALAEPESDIKLIFRAGLLGNKFMLLNSDDSRLFLEGEDRLKGDRFVEGRGFSLNEREQSVVHSPFRAGKDMWLLDDARMEKLRSTGIRNRRVEDLHALAKEKLRQARDKLEAKNYNGFMNLAREAWALEARAYPSVQGTANDVIKGVIFYFAILLPFAFFAERLLFAFPDVRKQLAGIGGFFMLIYFILHFIHPAFRISKTPVIILDGFFTLAMGGLVIMIVLNKFNDQMAKIRQKTAAIHGADVARGSATMAAFVLGISNMRRRKMRTALTCVTLILLTFTVMSFTSFDTELKVNDIPTNYSASYQGILLRRRDWGALEENAFYSIADFFKMQKDSRIALRTWKSAPNVGGTLSLQVTNVADPTRTFSAMAMLGLSPSEADITRPDNLLVAGRWFKPEEDQGEFVCIVPKRMAEFLGIAQDDFKDDKYRIKVSGNEYRVIGIIDGGGLYENRDLDNEPLTPVDWIEMSQRQEGDRGTTGGEEEEDTGEESLPELYIHMEGDNVLIIPAGLSMQLGASLQSVTVRLADLSTEEIKELLEKYVKRLKLILFAGIKEKADAKGSVWLYSSRDSLSVAGLSSLAIPILIAALIVFNTMLGSVYERTREISIYAAVGLAPIHIGALFLAESCVYATLGAILGYLLGQTVAFIIVSFGIWQELSLNYSATSAVVTTLIVVATVILSTIFPAKKAAELSVPDETRKLKLPKPDGDHWTFDFPFTVSKVEAVALNMFLFDYFKAHDEDSIGRFCADKIDLKIKEDSEEEIYVMSSVVWIAPLDMGISQWVRIETMSAPDDPEVDVMRFFIDRASGEVDTWRRMNTGFLKDIRKQLLIWRLVEPAYKLDLTLRGYETLGVEPSQEIIEHQEKAKAEEEKRKKRGEEEMDRRISEEEEKEKAELDRKKSETPT